MKYFISLISALLFTFTVFAQGVLEIKQSRQTLKNLLADDQPMTVVYTAQNTGTQPVIITRVTPMTSLLKADWPKSPLLPGKSCDIKITMCTSGTSWSVTDNIGETDYISMDSR